MNPIYEDNFKGSLVGLAIGEAVGQVSKGLSRAEVAQKFGIVRDYNQSSNSLTENTALALVLANSIVATGGKVDCLDFAPRSLYEFETTFQALRHSLFYENLDQAIQSGDFMSKPVAGLPENSVAARIAPVGLLHAYGRFDRERFVHDCEQVARFTHHQAEAVEGGVVMAVAVRLLCRDELLPEDLMSATLDYLPFGLPSDNPLREKLLASQDYLEERQTLVDNVQAGALTGIDLFRVDLNNLQRCGTGGKVAEAIAAAFYAFAAYKHSFEEAVTLAVNAGGEAPLLGALTGALAGAYHGLTAIPERWRTLPLDSRIAYEIAPSLHKTARSRELTDYLNTGI